MNPSPLSAERRCSQNKSTPSPEVSRCGIVLLGNYRHDGQESMQRFSDVLLSEFQRLGMNVTLLTPRPFFGNLKPSANGIGKWLGYLDKFLLFPFALRRHVHRHRRDHGQPPIVHLCDHSNGHYTRYLSNVPHLVTCHDLFAVRMARDEFGPGLVGFTGRCLQRLIAAGLRRAQKIACVSTSTKNDVVRLLRCPPDEIEVVYNGLNYPYSPLPIDEARQRISALLAKTCPGLAPGAAFPYILHVGGNHWYKNRAGVMHIYAALRRECRRLGVTAPKLIAAGPALTSELKAVVEGHAEWKDDIITPGMVTNEDLRALYSAAELLLFPSLEEGFGWPIIEAQACGCRVVTTGKGPMNEIGGDHTTYLLPKDVGSLTTEGDAARCATVVLDVLQQSASTRSANVTAGLRNAERFSTKRMVEEYLRLYCSLLSNSPTSAAAGGATRSIE